MARRIMLCGLLALLAANATAADEPQWLKEARGREATPPEAIVIQSQDGRFKARVPARARGEIVEEDGSYSLELEIGAGVEPAFCEIFPEGVDMADGLRLTAAATFDILAEAQGRIETRAVERTDAGWNGAAAFLQADWIYTVTIDDQKRLGALKQIMFERDGASVYCSHNDIGYRQSFERATHELARTLEWSEAAPVARYAEVLVASVNDRRLGVARLRVERDAEGDDRVTTTLSMLVPMAGGEVQSHDEVQVEFVTSDRDLINALQVVNRSGAIETEIRLDPHEEGDWLVSGQFKGKSVEATIPGEQVPRSSLEQYALIGALLQSPEPAGRTVEYLFWSDNNPLALTEADVTAVARLDGDHWSTRMVVAGMTFDAVADARDGTVSKVAVPLGHLTMSLERVAKLGRL